MGIRLAYTLTSGRCLVSSDRLHACFTTSLFTLLVFLFFGNSVHHFDGLTTRRDSRFVVKEFFRNHQILLRLVTRQESYLFIFLPHRDDSKRKTQKTLKWELKWHIKTLDKCLGGDLYKIISYSTSFIALQCFSSFYNFVGSVVRFFHV